MQYLLLARHGNTFAPGQKVVWVGARNDLPLVESGIAQAHIAGQALREASVTPQTIYASELRRTAAYAQIVQAELSLNDPICIDHRLNEIDYGDWSGLTNDEIKRQFGVDELDEWNQYGRWPKSFIGSEANIEKEIKTFIEDEVVNSPGKKNLLAVTSNGRLKYFLKLIPDIYAEFIEKSKWKVSTGQLCLLSYAEDNWQVICWNESPTIVSKCLDTVASKRGTRVL